ncbi:MAG: D-2-hydroxyacid dehydrogenase [Rhodospirillales bacterium]|nr:D-2-hydroxyacid dehydrogenase [Rhodospirillales bacterium]
MIRVLIHHNEPEPLRDRLLELVLGVEVGLSASYDALIADTTAFGPDVQFHIRFEDKTYPIAAVFDQPSLRWIAVGGVGVDHLGPWDPKAILVTNGAGVATEALAWHVIGSIIALTLKYPTFARRQADHVWSGQSVGHISGKTICVVGLGHIGRDIARMAKALGLTVVGTRANPQPTDNVDRVYAADDLHAALAEADFVAVATPKTERTIGLIDRTAFAAMKPGAMLVDVSRGGVTLAVDLMAALDSGHVAGASLDVFDPEPMPEDHPLWDYENVMITPHSCATFEGWELRSIELFADNLKRYMAGEPVFNVVDPVRGY